MLSSASRLRSETVKPSSTTSLGRPPLRLSGQKKALLLALREHRHCLVQLLALNMWSLKTTMSCCMSPFPYYRYSCSCRCLPLRRRPTFHAQLGTCSGRKSGSSGCGQSGNKWLCDDCRPTQHLLHLSTQRELYHLNWPFTYIVKSCLIAMYST
ncbi:hypothetical protein DAEQUDRAFT_560987 [Daedalea quercina L-15889]|uniref:Uncharacterized protein n=1 Tax=Daedalea quercina L-15889 TaxID=1314783 RepID=A0A165M1E9_9APHY|nr:hypothetical protein DAEQUDRAFT_560987 [Daedalea quercina L-15889]